MKIEDFVDREFLQEYMLTIAVQQLVKTVDKEIMEKIINEFPNEHK